MIRVVADENIPAIDRALPGNIDLRLLAGRQIDAESVRSADALLVRSVTRVDRKLLEGSPVSFVASATAGLDHVESTWLQGAGVQFASAPGSNAESVAEYIAATLLHLGEERGIQLAGKSIGIVGAGQCGSRVGRVARALGMDPLFCDPPLGREDPRGAYVELDALTEVDYLTLHVPFTPTGPDRTNGLISEAFIDRMKPGAILINASRGGVVDETALSRALDRGTLAAAVCDAWVGEPGIDSDLLSRVTLGTPHIAGYSTDGKYRGTEMVARAFEHHFGLKAEWTPESELKPIVDEITPDAGELQRVLHEIVKKAYPITRDAEALASTLALSPVAAAREFDRLRRDYPRRREFSASRVNLSPDNEALKKALEGLGFTVSQ